MRRVFILLALAAGAGLAGCQAPRAAKAPFSSAPPLAPEARRHAEAMSLFSHGLLYELDDDFDAAYSNYVHVARLEPDSDPVRLRVAGTLIGRQRWQEAEQYIESQIKPADTNAVKWLQLLAITYRAAGRTNDLPAVFERIVKDAPAEPAGYLESAAYFLGEGKNAEAIATLEEGVTKVKDTQPLLRMLSLLYIQRVVAQGKTPAPGPDSAHAVRVLKQLVDVAPDDKVARIQLAELLFLNKEIDASVAEYERIISMNLAPADEIYPKVGLRLMASGERAKAIAIFEKMLARRTGHYPTHQALGELYEQEGRKADALKQFRAAMESDPDSALPFVRAAILETATDIQAARATLRAGLQRFPEDARLQELMARLALQLGHYEEAFTYCQSLDKIVHGQPDAPLNVKFAFLYALVAQKAGHTNEAAAQLERLFKSNPATLGEFIQLTLQPNADGMSAEQALGQMLATLQQLATRYPGHPQLLLRIGLFQLNLNQYAEAAETFGRLQAAARKLGLPETTADSPFYFWYGTASERSGQFEKAEELLERSIQLNPRNEEALNYLAYMWAERGLKLEQALSYVQRALEIKPEAGAYIDTLAWIYFQQGLFEKALEQIDRALKYLPGDTTVTGHRADILHALKRHDEAITTWKTVLALDPQHPEAAEKVRQIEAEARKAAEAPADVSAPQATPVAPAQP